MTVLDQVRLGKYTVHPEVLIHWPTFIRKQYLRPTLEQAIPIDVDNVREWMENEWKSASKKRRFSELFPDLEPSFPVIWWEFSGMSFGLRVERGILTVQFEAGWKAFLFERGNGIIVLTHDWIIRDAKEYLVIGYARGHDEHGDEGFDFVTPFSFLVLLSQSLLHCKNVSVMARPKPPKLAKTFRGKHGINPAVFRVVTIQPMKSVLRPAGGVPGIGPGKAEHIVRGHFRVYLSERPLFGKVAGRFFFKSHDRGDRKLGVRPPGYKLKSPASTNTAVG